MQGDNATMTQYVTGNEKEREDFSEEKNNKRTGLRKTEDDA